MKINKILAAGVAATLAVTSLSAVASAEVKTREFDMSQSIGAWDAIGVNYKSVYGTLTATDRAYATETNRAVINFSVGGVATLYKLDGMNEYALQIVPKKNGALTQTMYTKDKGTGTTGDAPNGWNGKWTALWSFDLANGWWSAADVTVSGYKFDAKGTKTKVTQTAKADAKYDGVGYLAQNYYELVVLPDDVLTYKDGTAIAPAYFDEIEDVAVSLTLNNNAIYWDDVVCQFTADESQFNLATSLLKAIKIPISDAIVTYTDDAGKTVVGADADYDYNATYAKDGIETYTGTYASNRGFVQSQIKRVQVTYGQTDVEKDITDAIAYMDDNPSEARDKTTNPITEGTDVLSTEKYKQVGVINVLTENEGGTEVAALDAAGYVTEGTPVVCKTADDKFVTLYKVIAPDSAGGANIPETGVEFVDVKSLSPYSGAEKVHLYTVADKLPVYSRTENPTTWSGYKQVRAGAVSTELDVDKYILLAGGSYSVPKKKMQTLAAEVAIYDIAGSVKGGNTAAAVIAYCIAHGGYDPAKELKYVEGVKGDVSTSNRTRYAYLERTTSNSVIGRQDVKVLSYTGAHASLNGGDVGISDSANQSYNTVDNWNKGTKALQFAGLASHCADFFNKQNNGTITFHFVSPAATGSSWVNGGIPSTEVGLKSALGSTAMAIFFNYSQSTGSLQCNGVVDADAATVTFDISETLNDMGGWTKGNISDIYYGMNQGLRYSDYAEKDKWDVGYLVDKVTLAYDDAPAAVDANTDDDAADDDAAVVVADDDDDDDVVADDDDDIAEDDDIIEDDDDDDDDAGEIIEDDDDDDDDVNNDVDYVDADDDANPGTGVGLAVIPAIVAGAALVVSKKRK